MGEKKQSLRLRMLKERSAIPVEERERLSLLATSQLLKLPALMKCETVLAFYPFRDEIDTKAFIESAARRGQKICLPITETNTREMTPYVYMGQQHLRQGAYGIYEPDPNSSHQADRNSIEAVIVPGVAFDQSGGRLGYGGGYYDRFLANLTHKPLLIGFAFSPQVVEKVPVEEHDYKLDFLVTDKGISGPFAVSLS